MSFDPWGPKKPSTTFSIGSRDRDNDRGSDEVSAHLDRAARQGSRLGCWGFGLAAVLAGAVLLLLSSAAAAKQWIDSSESKGALLLSITATVVLAWWAVRRYRRRRGDRAWAARRLETANPALLDRLITLAQGGGERDSGQAIGSAKGKHEPIPEAYRQRISEQAARELDWTPDPFTPERTQVRRLGLLLALTFVLAWTFFTSILPEWQIESWRAGQRAMTDSTLDLESPLADAAEVGKAREPWGEVRITEPGRDLEVTKVDVVPLQIEAAASQPLSAAGWRLARSGEEPEHRRLELPFASRPDPATTLAASSEGRMDLGATTAADDDARRYAVFRPVLYVDELYLSDWDVVTYWATASDEREGKYSSEIYFLEVRPFRQEIQKLPGGPGGAAFRGLSQMSALIDAQKRVLKETHRHLSRASRLEAEQRRREQGKLVDAERDVYDSTRLVYAEVAEMEHQAIAPVLDHLAKAAEHLENATSSLESFVDDAVEPEHEALAELVATRKGLQKAISENPEAFGGMDSEPGDPTAELPQELDQIAEFRDAHQAARKKVEQVLEEQKKIAKETAEGLSDKPERAEDLRRRQESSRQDLADTIEQHPEVFEGLDPDTEKADRAMQEASEALGEVATRASAAKDVSGSDDVGSSNEPDPSLSDPIVLDAEWAGEESIGQEDPSDMESAAHDSYLERAASEAESLQPNAVQALEDLQESLKAARTGQELRDLQKLRKMLEAREKQLERMESEPEASDRSERSQAAESTRQLAEELAKVVRTESGESILGDEAREATSAGARRELDRAMSGLERSSGGEDTARAAGEGKEALGAMGEAIDQSLPDAARQGREGNPLGSSDGGALDQSLARLRSMARSGSPGGEGKATAADAAPSDPAAERTDRTSFDARRDALEDLRQAMAAEGLEDAQAQELMDRMEEALVGQGEGEGGVDLEVLRRLVDAIELLRLELAEESGELEPVTLAGIDPESLPAEYRERIQRYLVELSEQKGGADRRANTHAGSGSTTDGDLETPNPPSPDPPSPDPPSPDPSSPDPLPQAEGGR